MLKRLTVLFFACFFLCFFSAILSAADSCNFVKLYQVDAGAGVGALGYSVAGAGDINGDGKADFIIGAHDADIGELTNAGSVFVYSGADGSLIYRINGSAWYDNFGYAVSGAGDVNGDNRADFIVGAVNALANKGRVYVYSGKTGNVLFWKDGAAYGDHLGVSVASAGDVNADGRADFIIGAYAADPGGLIDAGSAFVYSGANGALLYQKNGTASGDQLGISVASAGDVNGDGRADFIIGARFADPGGLDSAGSVYLYSGVDGSLIYQKNGTSAGDHFGQSVSSAGDVNGDGSADFIIGAPGTDPGGSSYAGAAFVFSGTDGSLLYQKNGIGAGDALGFSAASAGDVNGDGRADFIVGAFGADPGGLDAAGSAYVYSGVDGSLLYQKNGEGTTRDFLGFSVASAGDANGDGKADFIIGAWFADAGGVSDAGSVYVYCGAGTKGDMNVDGNLTLLDITLMLNCIFWGIGGCDFCFSDVNCDSSLSPADIVQELNAVFLGNTIICS